MSGSQWKPPALPEVTHFDGQKVRQIDVETLEDRLLFELPDGREATGQNCVTPNGVWFVYITTPTGTIGWRPCKDACLVAYNLDTHERRVLKHHDIAIHHVIAYDNEYFLYCHPKGHTGILLTDLRGGNYPELRAGDPNSPGHICHYMTTRRGVSYEVLNPHHTSGIYDPFTRKRFEFMLPADWGYTHTGWDPEGRLWLYECTRGGHRIRALKSFDFENGKHQWEEICGDWPTYGKGQKSHFHPQITPDRKWILMTGGDKKTETNHIFLIDISDLREAEGLSADKLDEYGHFR